MFAAKMSDIKRRCRLDVSSGLIRREPHSVALERKIVW